MLASFTSLLFGVIVFWACSLQGSFFVFALAYCAGMHHMHRSLAPHFYDTPELARYPNLQSEGNERSVR